MKYKAKRDIDYSKDDGWEDYGIVPCGEMCETDILYGIDVITYKGIPICDIDSEMTKDCFEEVIE
ncbi:MAG: hypothetical protein NC548_54225 [Lachnospiraceae bacterium]|nr:hypothetical protein [Lachnospiraceae bacterium]